MKIIINSAGTNKKIYLPNFLIKSKFVLKIICKEENEGLVDFILSIYKDLIKYIKKNGHFTILDMESNEGESIKIVI